MDYQKTIEKIDTIESWLRELVDSDQESYTVYYKMVESIISLLEILKSLI